MYNSAFVQHQHKIRKPVQVRDLWQHKSLGSFDGSFTAQVPRHGAVLVKVQ